MFPASGLVVSLTLLLEPLATHEAVVAKNIVSGKCHNNNGRARGSPPLQVVQRLLNTSDDVGKSTVPAKRMPHHRLRTRKKLRSFLDVLANIALCGRLIFREVHQCK